MIRTLPNILTFSRIIAVPLLVACFFVDGTISHILAASLFIAASITDFFDGYLARAWQVQTKLGRFLDPIADKLLVCTAIIMLVFNETITSWHIIPAIAIVAREIFVSGLREFLAELQKALPVSKLGKIKTASQMTALFLLLLGSKGSGIVYTTTIGLILLWIAALLTLMSGYAYLQAGWVFMSDEPNES